MFERVAVLGEGTRAVRALRALRTVVPGVRVVALVPQGHQETRFAREADEVREVGRNATPESVQRALAGVDAVWPPGGPAAALITPADVAGRAGMAFLGPDPETLRGLSDSNEPDPLGAGTAPDSVDGAPSVRVVTIGGPGWATTVGTVVFRAGDGVEVLFEFPAPLDLLDHDLPDRLAQAHRERSIPGLATWTVTPGRAKVRSLVWGPDPAHAAIEAATGRDLAVEHLQAVTGETVGPGVAPAPPAVFAAAAVLRTLGPTRRIGPDTGLVAVFRVPTGPGVQVDLALAQGDRLPDPPGDSPPGTELAVIAVRGAHPEAARAGLFRALEDTAVAIPGSATTRSLAIGFLREKEQRPAGAGVALLCAAVAAHEADQAVEIERFVASAGRGRPELTPRAVRAMELRLNGSTYRLGVRQTAPGVYAVETGDRVLAIRVEPIGTYEWRLRYGGAQHRILCVPAGPEFLVEAGGELHRVESAAGSTVRAPAPAVVVGVRVDPGAEVEPGDPLVVLEAMKMEMTVTAPFAGRVREVVAENTQVAPGDLLARIDPPEHVRDAAADTPVDLASDAEPLLRSPEDRCRHTARELRHAVLGFDEPPAAAGTPADRWAAVVRGLPPDHPALLDAEEGLLRTFADVESLSSRAAPSDGPDDLVRAPQDSLLVYLRTLDARDEALPSTFVEDLRRALRHHQVRSLDRSPQLEEALYRLYRASRGLASSSRAVAAILDRWLGVVEEALRGNARPGVRPLLDRLVSASERRFPEVADLARELRYRVFDQPALENALGRVYEQAERDIEDIEAGPPEDRPRLVAALKACPQPIRGMLISALVRSTGDAAGAFLEALVRRYYRLRDLQDVRVETHGGRPVLRARYALEGKDVRLFASAAVAEELAAAVSTVAPLIAEVPPDDDVLTDYFLWDPTPSGDADVVATTVQAALTSAPPPRPVRRAVVTIGSPSRELGAAGAEHFSFRYRAGEFVEDLLYRGLHPMIGKRLDLWRLSNFSIVRLPSVEDVYLFHAVGRDNPRDERLLALAEVRDLTPVRDASGKVVQLPYLERMLTEALAGIRRYQSQRPAGKRLQWNRILLYVWPTIDVGLDETVGLIGRLSPLTEGLGLEKVLVRGRWRDPESRQEQERVLAITNRGLTLRFEEPADRPIRPLTEYRQKVVRTRQRGLVYPYEIVTILTPDAATRGEFPPGEFREHDLDDAGRLAPVERPYGQNTANVVVGVITNALPAHPEGAARVAILGDPSRALGSLAEPECRRIIAALDLAESMGVPVEWFAVSAGAKISMDSGTENMDWIARVLRRLIEFTQAGGEVNVVVCHINVGAQPYWNAEATMLMHTRGILIMTRDSAMVLTGKQALDYSGGVSAEDNTGIGGYERVMGPNGQAQYWAEDVHDACKLLLRHYEHTYVAPGEGFPRRVATSDPRDRDIRDAPHRGQGFATVGEVFSDPRNPERKRPFDIRSVMAAVVDSDHAPLERWGAMRDAETVVVWDAHLGGIPICLLGMESRPLPRFGPADADGPEYWTAGTLFPLSSKKAARAINAASGNRPVVVLANLSGFDGSPESLRKLQLEYGAEIGRAVVNFRGPLVFCVVSRYHGGAFVVFSATLNENLEVAALEGSFASVIGGAPAAAVVFAREVDSRVRADDRIRGAEEALEAADGNEKVRLRARLDALRESVRAEKLGQVAEEFDSVHDIYRAQKTGSVHHIIPPAGLRPYLIDAVERGLARTSGRSG